MSELPKNLAIEKNIIGAFFKMDQSEIKSYSMSIDSDIFFSDLNLRIFAEINKFINDKLDIDLVSISAKFNDDENMYICECAADIATTAMIDSWIDIANGFMIKRKFISKLDENYNLIIMANNPSENLFNFGSDIIDLAKINRRINTGGLTGIQAMFSDDVISSGFLTHDYNDGGLKPSNFTLLLGAKNHGKTTLARQFLIACSMQNKKCFFFCGENGVVEEQINFAKISCDVRDLLSGANKGGRVLYCPNPDAVKNFKSGHGKNIIFVDDSNVSRSKINFVFSEMEKHAKKGVRLFVLDNLMILTDGAGNKVFEQQKTVTEKITRFKKEFNANVILIAHPKKGKGMESTSGIADLENLADTIIRYVRLSDDPHQMETQNYKSKDKLLKHVQIDSNETQNVSAVIMTEKVRNGGTKFPCLLEWNEKRGVAIEVTSLPKAQEYQDNGYWVRAVHRYGSADRPQTPEQYQK